MARKPRPRARAETCKVHPHVKILRFCPACRGTVGGRQLSEQQRERNRQAALTRWRHPKTSA